MTINFNVDPYYDDFDSAKNYHRILFKPGVAVQARELTQSQTILQNQITSFADNIFKQNSPVTGGQVTTNFNCYYIKLQATYNNINVDATQFLNALVTNATGTVVARVIAVASATGSAGVGDPPTLIVSYKSGIQFVDNDIIYDVNSNLAAQALSLNSSGLSSVASISKGVFYVLGNFVQVSDSTVILSKYTNTPSLRVGLTIDETTIDYINDSSLLDPALGASNYQAPGADRYLISLSLDTRPLAFGDDSNFIELVRVDTGNVFKMVDGSVYSVIDDYFAKRDYETNGDYVVNDFKLTPKTNSNDANTYILNVGKGLAYVHGYRVENPSPVDLVTDRARSISSIQNNPVYTGYGNYFYVSNVRGANSSFFSITQEQPIDLHCVSSSNVNISSSSSYNSTKVASGFARGLVYDHDSSDASSNTYVYKMYVHDLQNSILSANVASANTSNVTFPSSFSSVDNAYTGVSISITSGIDSGDFRTITSYVGATRTATINSPWSITPTNQSVFALNFDTTDVESILDVSTASYPATIYGTSQIDLTGKVNGLASGDTILENPSTPELLFTIGNPFVQGISSGSYTSTIVYSGVNFTPASGSGYSMAFTGNYAGILQHIGDHSSGNRLPDSEVLQQYTIIVTATGGNSNLKIGDIVPWTSSANTNRKVILTNGGATATFSTSAADIQNAFTATIIAKVQVITAVDTNQNVILKKKTLITPNTTNFVIGTSVNNYTFVDDSASSTGQVYIQDQGLVAPGQKQSLYLSDVYSIAKIIDTKTIAATPTQAMLTDSSYDVTNNYLFDNGQRDSIYDHSSITLKPGAPQPQGNLLVLVNYFKHSGGDGYFSEASYPIYDASGNAFYRQIPTYQAKSGTYYNLRDSFDFRPARLNAQPNYVFKYSNSQSPFGVLLPIDGTIFNCNYSYYLARKDLLVLTKDRSLQVVEGTPSLNPIFPPGPDNSLTIANITHNPYTGYLPTEVQNGMSDLSIEKVQHKRYTMQDIASLDARIGQVEYYTSLSALEQSATNMQVTDAYGLNRFKNGILVDDFSSYSTADTSNIDYTAAINKRTRQMTASQNVMNFPLKNLALVYNASSPSPSLLKSLDYTITTDGLVNYFSLPYTSANLVSQPIASRYTNINPFSVSSSTGVLSLSPNVDNWVDTNYAPSLLITDPSLQVFQSSNTVNILSVGDWQTVSGTTVLSGVSSTSSSSTAYYINHTSANWGYGTGIGKAVTTTTTATTDTYTTTLQQQQNNLLGPYSKIGNTYAQNNGYITDISIISWIRPQEVAIRANGLLFNSQLQNFFDNINVNQYMRKPNVIELSNVSGSFNQGDVIGYQTGGEFYATGLVVDVYTYPSTTSVNMRLYVAADSTSNTYNNGLTLYNATFDANGNWVPGNYTAQGTINSVQHNGGVLFGANNIASTVTLSPIATVANNMSTITGNTIYIVSGSGVGQSATITGYNSTTKVANVTPALTTTAGDVYSIGSTFSSNEEGNYCAMFNVPTSTFHTGQRVFNVDNRINNDIATVTTSAQGTFYAEGLQTTSQQLNFGASPSGAKSTFTQTNQKTVSYTTSTTTVTSYQTQSPYDPLAQTFLIDPNNYPNGAFLSSIKLFFQSKPINDTSKVTLSIVGTLNGYPNGDTLDHSIVSLPPSNVNANTSPQVLDPNTYTEFTFNSPVYIAPNTLYAFMLNSNSNEYTLWTAANGDTALPSSVKNLPTDPPPTNITKITTAPYVGGLFISQNSQTWNVDQNQSLMFVLDRCVFDTTKTPTIAMVVPKLLPNRTIIEQSIDYLNNSNTVSNTVATITTNNINVDAFNLTTTDFVPSSTSIYYNYSATLLGGSTTSPVTVNPGKYGTSMYDHIFLNDNNGERVLLANSSTSFIMNALLSSNTDAVSPIISDAGSTLYAIQNNINNCPLSNSLITLISGGSSYNVGTTSVTVSAPTGKNGTQAYASANISNGVIQSVYFTYPGTGYIVTPTITITDSNIGYGANVAIFGETSPHGGPAEVKYFTKKVVLAAGNDSSDLNVYLTAYRPVNTDILVYYKILSRQDTQKFEDGSWQLMTKTQSSDTLYSQSRSDLFEFSFAPGTNGTDQGYVSYTSITGQTYTTFSQFAIKVVLVSSDNTSVPFLSDIRCMALPANVNTSV